MEVITQTNKTMHQKYSQIMERIYLNSLMLIKTRFHTILISAHKEIIMRVRFKIRCHSQIKSLITL